MLKKSTLFFMLLLGVFSLKSYAQVEISSTPYTTLKLAFDAINAGTHTGAIVVNITGSPTETVSAVLNASGTGGASYTSITISPTGGAARTISGSVTGYLIDLNGADNVTINGLNTGGNSLTISNAATGASGAVRFIGDASNNVITNCNITGSSSTASNGVIFFSTGTTTGNDNNNINNCNITGEGSNLPNNCIFSLGTSAAIDNSTNTVSTNNIFDYFSATLVTGGINLSTGNSAWTISSNRLYQTANRTYTTANTHLGINAGSGENYTITGNVIGYANSSGTGTTNMIGLTSGSLGGTFPSSFTTGGTANATRYIAISAAFTAGGIASSIQNNTIAGFALYTSSGATTTNGILCGINITSGNANVGTVTGNTIGATTGNSSIYTCCTTTNGTVVGIYASSVNTVTIKNNTVGAINAMGSTATINGGITGINTAGTLGSHTVTNNTIGNATNPNLRTGNLTEGGNLSNVGTTFGTASGTGIIRGILNGATGTVSIGTLAEPNIIRNFHNNGTGTGASMRGIEVTAGVGLVNGNQIFNLTSPSGNLTEATAGLAILGILYSSTTTGCEVNDNTIYSLSLTNTGTVGTNVAGIGVANATNIFIMRNFIYDLSNASTTTTVTDPGTASGIFLRSGTTAQTIANNMISLGTGQTTNTTFIGIWNNNGSTPDPVYNIYYNSIYIAGTASSGAQPSFGYVRGDLTTTARTVTVNIKNNVLDNARTGGTGSHYAISNNYNVVAPSTTGWGANASNNNVLNSPSASTIGHWAAAQTFNDWKTASASDVSSVASIPITYVATATANLRFNMGVTPTSLESGGTVVSITTDIDGFARPKPAPVNGGGTAPDFGASESDMVPLDIFPPTITYTAFSNTSSTGNRTLVATITDAGGVQTGANGPRLYYKKSTDPSYIFDNAPSVLGNDYTFTLNTGTLGGVVTGTIIQYYVAAQDLNANVATNPAGGSGASPPGTTAPGSPATYTVVPALSGVYTVGAGGDYANLTAVANAINPSNAAITGHTWFELLSTYNSASETYPIVFSQFIGDGWNVTIFPQTGVVGRVTEGDPGSGNPLIDLDGIDRLILDGRQGGFGSNEWLIRNTRTAATVGPVIRLVNDAQGNTFRYLQIEGQNSTTTSGLIFLSTSTGTGGNTSNVIVNNTIRDRTDVVGVPANCIYSSGTVGALNSLNQITVNNILNFSNSGISVSATGNGDSWIIGYNNLYNNLATPPSTAQTAINFIPGTGSNSNIISNNNIGGSAINCGGTPWVGTGAVTFTGISTNVGTISVTNITNNVIKNIDWQATGTAAVNGITCVTNGLVNVADNQIGGPTAGEQIKNAGNSTLIGISSTVGSTSGITISTNTIQNLYCSGLGTGIGNRGISHTGAGNLTVSSNTISNNVSDASTASDATSAALGIYTSSTNTSQLIQLNTISGLQTNGSTGNTAATTTQGIIVTSASSSGTISRNRIYGLINTSTASNGDIFGIHVFLGAWNVYNNQITLNQNTNGVRSVGIFDSSSTTARSASYIYNSVFLTGTDAGVNNSYGFLRSNNASTVSLRDNFFYNQRTGGSGFHYAIGNNAATPATGWSASASNFNMLISADATRLGEWGAGTGVNFTDWKISSAGGDIASLSFTSASIPSTLFSNTSTGNLNINTSDPNCWYLNGNASQLTPVAVDYSGDARSQLVSTGTTDIGSDEFTPAIAAPTISFPVILGVNNLSIGGRPIGVINVVNTGGGTWTTIDLQYFGGVTPPGAPGGSHYGYGYAVLTPNVGAAGFTYDVSFYYVDEVLGSIAGESNIRLAKSDDGGTTWTPYLTAGTGPGQYQLDMVNNIITVYGLTTFSSFALTDDVNPMPVELSSFTASANKNSVILNWSTVTEINNSGFDIERKLTGDNNWIKAGNVAGNGTSNIPHSYNFECRNLPTGKYNFRLKQIDYNGNHAYFNLSNEIEVGIPTKFDISQNYPNPFNPTTKINYDLPFDSKVSIKIFDMTGREVATIVNGLQTAGYHTVQFNGANLASGVYFYNIIAEGGNASKFVTTKKMVLVK